jgi:uncharacterized protein involved in exopolysaccharide biosynthesis
MLICFLSVAAVLTVLALSYVFPPTYISTSKLMIRYGRENIPLNPIGKITTPFSTMSTWEQTVKSEIELIRNQYLAQEVVNQLGVDFDSFPPSPPPTTLWGRTKQFVKDILKFIGDGFSNLLFKAGFLERLPPYESAVNRVMGGLEVSMVTDTSVLDVNFRSMHPGAAKEVLERIIQLYLEHRLEVYRDDGAYRVFEEQVNRQKQKLQEASDKLARFMLEKNITILDKQRDLLLTKLDVLREKLFIFQLDLLKTREKFAEGSDEVNLAKGLIRETEEEIRSIDATLLAFNEAEPELGRLQRNFKVAEENYFVYHEKKEDTKIVKMMDLARISNVSLVQPASVPIQPTRTLPMLPNKTFRLLVALVLGPCLGFAIALMSEYFDPSVKSVADLEERLSLPVWSAIPEDRGLSR